MTPVEPDTLELPPCVTPRPGEQVVLYQSGLRICGELVGHNAQAQPWVKQNNTNGMFWVESFEMIRVAQPKQRQGPNWMHLPAEARIVKPADKHVDVFNELLARSVAGVPHQELLYEIWSRGYEVFLTDRTVRDALAGREPVGLEVATTMPASRLHLLAQGMYDAESEFGEFDRMCGTVPLGAAGTPVRARVFPLTGRGTSHARFASSFKNDTGYRDFACHCVYYDPFNKVLVDPTGTGIDDALGRRLHMVFDRDLSSRVELGRMGLRAAVMLATGFEIAEDDEQAMADLCDCSRGLDPLKVVHQLKHVITEETSLAERREVLERLFAVSADRFGEHFAKVNIFANREELSS